MNRRGFFGSMLALAAAPAIVRAESLMRIRPLVRSGLLLPRDPGFAQAMLRIYDGAMGTGALLAEIPMPLRLADPNNILAGFEKEGDSVIGIVQATGVYRSARIDFPGVLMRIDAYDPGLPLRINADNMILGNNNLNSGGTLMIGHFAMFPSDR